MKIRLHGIKVERRTDRDIEREAHILRKSLGLEPDEPAKLDADLFETLDQYVVETKHGMVWLDWDVRRLKGPNAITTFEDTHFKIVLSDSTYEKLEAGVGQAKVTLAHELGHVALHGDELIELTQIQHFDATLQRLTNQFPAEEDSEVQADKFAASFLLPIVAVQRNAFDIETLVKRYGVSTAFARKRVHTICHRRPKGGSAK